MGLTRGWLVLFILHWGIYIYLSQVTESFIFILHRSIAQDVQTIFTMIIVRGATHQTPLGLHQRPVGPVHLVVEPAGVAEVVPVTVTPPQRGWCRSAVDTLATLWTKGNFRGKTLIFNVSQITFTTFKSKWVDDFQYLFKPGLAKHLNNS